MSLTSISVCSLLKYTGPVDSGSGLLKEVIEYCKVYGAKKHNYLKFIYVTNQEYSNADHF